MLDQFLEGGGRKAFYVPTHCLGGIDARQKGGLSGGALREAVDPETGVERDGVGNHFSKRWKTIATQRIDVGIVGSDAESIHEYEYNLQTFSHVGYI